MRAAVEARLCEVLGAEAMLGAEATAANDAQPCVDDTYFEKLRSELLAERERRSLVEARLQAQRSVTMRLRQENERLAAQLVLTAQRLRSVTRARDEMRRALERTDAMDARLRDAMARRQEAGSTTVCKALYQRVCELERQVGGHRRYASPFASQKPPKPSPPSSLVVSERRLSWD